ATVNQVFVGPAYNIRKKFVAFNNSRGSRSESVGVLKPPGAGRLDAERLLRGELQPLGEKEWVCYKPRWGAFHGTRIADYLRERRIDSLIVCGLSFPRGVLSTVFGASKHDFRVGLVTDGTSEVSEPEAGYMRGMGVQMLTTQGAVQLLTSV